MSFDVDAIRKKEYPWTTTGETIFLNAASTGAMPRSAIHASIEMTGRRATPTRIPDTEIFETLDRSRTLLSQLVGCAKEEIALMPNTSHGINLAANALPLARGDVVLSFEKEFPANVYPWMALARNGVELRLIRCVNGLPDEAQLLDSLSDKRVRAVAVSWVAFASGYRVDIARMGRECRARGIFFVVDGIQGLGPLSLDLSSLHVDIFASGCQKWLVSPWGTGFAYVRRELIAQLTPQSVGWLAFRGSEDFSKMTSYTPEFRDDARKFEVGTHGLQDFAAMNESVSMFLDNGPKKIEEHVASLAGYATECALSLSGKGVRLLSPADSTQRAGIVTIGVRDIESVAASLRARGVTFSVREGAIRLSMHLYNTKKELDAVFELIAAT